MNTSLLRNVRIIVSVLFFVPTTLVLIDFTELIPESFVNSILYFQFVPSFLKAIVIFSLSTTAFILIIILTVLFGRVYCSSICPLGFFQDIINNISRRINKRKKRFEFLKEQKLLRWLFVAIAFIPFIFGIILGINLLDPYSIYGRIAGNFIRPVAIWINNVTASILESMNNYTLYAYHLKAFNTVPFIITSAFLLLIVFLSYKKGRLYCNIVCPVGTILGFISKYSLFKIVIREEDCLSCGKCARECKASCINANDKTVDMSRCVSCFNCLTSCPTEGIRFEHTRPIKVNQTVEIDNSKRSFLISTGIYFASLSTILAQAKKQIVITKPSTIPVLRENAISPPGSISIDRFNSKCTACHLCVTSCPAQVLQPSFLEYGFTGMLQPRLDNNAGYCNFDCTICGDICPTGAILPLSVDRKHLEQVGIAKFIKENCVVETQSTACGACSEHCPTKAVHMIPYKNNIDIPEVREDFCIGCGACEYACPTKPYKSIYVEGNRIHKTATKNTGGEKPLKEINLKEDFPF